MQAVRWTNQNSEQMDLAGPKRGKTCASKSLVNTVVRILPTRVTQYQSKQGLLSTFN